MRALIKTIVDNLEENSKRYGAPKGSKRPLTPKAPEPDKTKFILPGVGAFPDRETAERAFPNHPLFNDVMKESNDGTDHIKMTVPLFIRCLEWAKETAKDDVDLHKFTEKVVAKSGVLETDDYDDLLPSGDTKTESTELDEISKVYVINKLRKSHDVQQAAHDSGNDVIAVKKGKRATAILSRLKSKENKIMEQSMRSDHDMTPNEVFEHLKKFHERMGHSYSVEDRAGRKFIHASGKGVVVHHEICSGRNDNTIVMTDKYKKQYV